MANRVCSLLLTLIAGVTLSACDDTLVAPENELQDNYIVVLKDSVNNPQAVIDELVEMAAAETTYRYNGAIKGFAGAIPEGALDALRTDERVDFVTSVEPVRVRPEHHSLYSPSAGSQVLPWGVDTVDADLSSTRAGNGRGAVNPVHVYVVDTGISKHPDLNIGDRVTLVGGTISDCHGHGTHVAGTVAARDDSSGVVGVAPGARLHSVKVLDCSGAGTTSGVIKGMNWIIKNARRPAVVNMSIGAGTHAPALHEAVVAAIQKGIIVVAAAGNSNVGVGMSEPAHVTEAITVGASDQEDCRATFSNFGRALDLFAPGTRIVSTAPDGGFAVMSGTSMAAPHVAGAVALRLWKRPSATLAQIRYTLVKQRALAVVDCGFRTAKHNKITTNRRLDVRRF